jgi:hypothetical protein
MSSRRSLFFGANGAKGWFNEVNCSAQTNPQSCDSHQNGVTEMLKSTPLLKQYEGRWPGINSRAAEVR